MRLYQQPTQFSFSMQSLALYISHYVFFSLGVMGINSSREVEVVVGVGGGGRRAWVACERCRWTHLVSARGSSH